MGERLRVTGYLAERRNVALRSQDQRHGEGYSRHGYDPNQPRMPAGNEHGGEWTRVPGTIIAAKEPPRFIPGILLEIARSMIKFYRLENDQKDMFGFIRKRGTVTVTTIDGKHIFGSNSQSPTYTDADYAVAANMRDLLIKKHPEVMKIDNIGEMPNDATFHAEATVLLRAARQNRGTLSGRTIEVYSDRTMCDSCKLVIPKLGMELGNPIVTFVEPNGLMRTMRNGDWVKKE